jgi:hypothetical protein
MKLANYSGPVKIGTALWFQEKNTDGSNKKVSSHTEWLMVKWDEKPSTTLSQGSFVPGSLNISPATPEFARKFVENFDTMSEADKNKILEALSFTDLSPRPRAQKAITYALEQFLGQNAIDQHRMTWQNAQKGWLGTRYESFWDGQCKYWMEQTILGATDVNISIGGNPFSSDKITNREALNYYWNSTADVSTLLQGGTNADHGTLGTRLKEQYLQGKLLTGDLIQYTMPTYAHTLMIGAVTEQGIWVLDSNYGDKILINNEWKPDNTPRYHFRTWENLNKTDKFTLYRINE